ncbi:hypothetical protein BJY04DRAFT_198877 [Aspergillus karnatakaensis]|uniref:shugoshin family protein n=1 Tax=Aspergillus karnatakaensis TaxID=1810916 RepID=UPI003CCD4A57
MARLNESTASAEPIEILKRRFVRQNRELARVNSIQSLRIRSLESEISHLLSENVSLREQVITLTQELGRFELAKALRDGVFDVKARLDSKLAEMSSLIAELGSLPRQFPKCVRRKEGSALQRPSRDSATVTDVDDADPEPYLEHDLDGRLPVILEDKYYPRRTLETHEVQALRDNNFSASPRSEHSVEPRGEVTVDDGSSIEASTHSKCIEKSEDHADSNQSLPPHLETKEQKRLEYTLLGKGHVVESSVPLLDSRFLRTRGAKRKFSADEEGVLVESTQVDDDGFEFSRPTQSPIPISLEDDQSPFKRKPQPTLAILSHGQPKRKVLEPKSTNANIPSPKKTSVWKCHYQHQNSITPEKSEDSLPKEYRDGVLDRNRRVSSKSSISACGDDKAVAGNASEAKAQVREKAAPPQDPERQEPLATADMPSSRPSRRRGAIVSYAEPNLRDKMRRSTNELGPAVSRDKSRRSMSQTDHSQNPNEQIKSTFTKKARGSSIASEEQELINTGCLNNQPERSMSLVSQRKRKTLGRAAEDAGENGEDNQSEGSGITDARNSVELPQDMTLDKSQISSWESPGLFSSRSQKAPDPTKKSRRHSSNTRTSNHSTMLKLSTTPVVEAMCNDFAAVYPEGSLEDSARTNESPDISQEYGNTILTAPRDMAREQRVAARRKSMML